MVAYFFGLAVYNKLHVLHVACFGLAKCIFLCCDDSIDSDVISMCQHVVSEM